APCIDHLIVNELEAARATGTEADADTLTDAATLQAMASQLAALGIRRSVVVHCATRAVWHGADGAQQVVEIPPLDPAEIASTLGAGDAFCAGLTFALHEGWSAERALTLAVATARASLRGHTATEAIPPLTALELR
ncbi:MAG: carbohydrate kinase family protein, partial [Pseudomonadota bacterium]